MRTKIFTKWQRLLLGAVPALLLSSCVMDKDDHTPGPDKGEAMVRFSIQLPAAATPAASRALDAATDENDVKEIDILVFEPTGGTFVYNTGCSGASITGSGQTKTFTVMLREGNFDIVMVANVRSIVSAQSFAGKNKAQALALLDEQMPTGGKWIADAADTDYKPFPMWGDVGNITIDQSTDLTGANAVKLTRMIARVDVQIAATVANFKLMGVEVYNYNTHGSLVPTAAGWNGAKATAPNVPAASTLTRGPIAYSGTEIDGTNSRCEREIYIFEAENHADAAHTTGKPLTARTCLVISGVWDANGDGDFTNDGPATYYRVDFSTGSGVNQTFLDVLRNHKYIFNITKVSGHGYPDSPTAFESGPFNIQANVVEWDDGQMGEIVDDGQFMLSVSQGEFSFGRDAITAEQADNVLYVYTDYAAGSASGWKVDRIVDAADGTTPVTWLTLSPDDGVALSKTKVVLTVTANNSTADREAIVWIAAGRLRYGVRVHQSNILALGVKVTDGTNAVKELVFPSGIGNTITAQRLQVDWEPKNADLSIVSSAVGSATAFPASSGAPGTTTVSGGTGRISYPITPPAFTDAEVNPNTGNPFLEKVTKLDFTTTNGLGYASASVFLRQIHYNLITDVKPGYMLGSQTETIQVRSNFAWKIKSVTDPDDILVGESALVGQTGGPNTTTGDAVSFTMEAETPNGSKSGKTAEITFERVSDGAEWKVTITAIEVLYVGMFGGELKADGNGVWQFTRPLYVQREDASTRIQWSTNQTATGVVSDWDGKGNTYSLRASTYPAANLCFQKNANHASITGPTDPGYSWYLPAQKQLMAVWVSHTSYPTANRFSSANYWSSAEGNATGSWIVNFGYGNTGTNYKTGTSRVRCVRE